MNDACVQCHQPLPSMSKLNKQAVPEEEAAAKGWTGTRSGDGTVIVNMCLQCQIERSERSKRS